MKYFSKTIIEAQNGIFEECSWKITCYEGKEKEREGERESRSTNYQNDCR